MIGITSFLPFLLILGVLCLVIGVALGWLIASMGRSSHKPAVRPAAPPAAPVAASAEPADSVIEPFPQPVGVGQPVWLLRLTRDPETGSLNMDIAGKLAQTPDELSAEERKQAVDLLRDTTIWLGLLQPAKTPVPPAAVPAPVSVSPVPAVTAARPLTLPDDMAVAAGSMGVSRPSIVGNMTNAIANVLSPVPVVKEAPKTMVQQIDEVLQNRLLGTVLANQKIYLIEDPRRGVLVNVGNEVYEGIGAVPEGDVKELLKSSVQEWERLQEELRQRRQKH
jgi:hypothetical protein